MEAIQTPPEEEREPSPEVHLWSGYDEIGPQAVGTIYKVSIGVQVDNALPRDSMYVTPHFRDASGATAPSGLATQIANNMSSFLGSPARGQVKVYLEDFNPGAIHNPLAIADFGTAGTFLSSSGPREVSLCLSYYAGQNTKRYRGRLYVPHAWIRVAGGGASAAPAPRPTAQMIATAASFATVVLVPPRLNGLDWTVASTVDKVARNVTNYWVDDEWDIQRRRGYRGTTRNLGTVP
jgi:hypothetical protein